MNQLILALALLSACSNDYGGPGDHEPGAVDPVIGATCLDDRDCVSQCARGSDFPGGFCTLSCRDDRDCTSDTICTDTQGGICLFPCDLHSDCGFLGPSYFCRDRRDTFDHRIFVCMSD